MAKNRDLKQLEKLSADLFDLGTEIPMGGIWKASSLVGQVTTFVVPDAEISRALAMADDWLDDSEAKLEKQGRTRDAKLVGRIRDRMATIRAKFAP